MKNLVRLDYKIRINNTPTGPKPELYDGSTHIPAGSIMRNFNKNNDDLRKIGHYRLGFEIENFTASALRFVPNQADVMWVQWGTQCPASPCSLPSEIWVDKMDPTGRRIEIINMDMTVGDFWFTLNFYEKGIPNPTPADYIALDPGGTNSNTGGAGSELQSYAVLESATGALAGLASATYLDQGFIAQNALLCALGGAGLGLAIGSLFRRR